MEQTIIESCAKRRIPLPEKILGAPTILKGLEQYYVAFWELSTTRQSGFGAGPIPWDSIDRYAVREGYEGDDYHDLVDFTRAMDQTFLAYHREKRAEQEASDRAKREGPITQRTMVHR